VRRHWSSDQGFWSKPWLCFDAIFLRYGREALTVAAFAKAAGRHARARFIAV
jgi:hypothetical protein